jgi:ferredoxin
MMNLSVDPDACCLFAQCVGTAPELFWIENEQLAWVAHPDESQLPLAREAVAGCPAQAISLTDEA